MPTQIQNPLFVLWTFALQLILIFYFAIRKTHFYTAITYGWLVYSLCIVGLIVSIQQILQGKSWIFWIGGFIFTAWAIFGFFVEYLFHISWRSPIKWCIFIPYVLIYLSMVMFYWWPLAEINKNFWYAYAGLFLISTVLNTTSHSK
jgi:hypothetical protein